MREEKKEPENQYPIPSPSPSPNEIKPGHESLPEGWRLRKEEKRKKRPDIPNKKPGKEKKQIVPPMMYTFNMN